MSYRGSVVETIEGILFSIINVITEGLRRTPDHVAINKAFPFVGEREGEGNLFRVAVGIQLSKQNNTLAGGGQRGRDDTWADMAARAKEGGPAFKSIILKKGAGEHTKWLISIIYALVSPCSFPPSRGVSLHCEALLIKDLLLREKPWG